MRKCAGLVCAVMMAMPVVAQQATPPSGDAATAANAVTAAPEHPITADQVHEMLQLTGALKLMQQMLDGLMPVLKQSLPPYMPVDVFEDFRRSLLGVDLQAALVTSYQAHISTEDAAQILTFYRTPAGQRLLAAMPLIQKDTQRIGQQMGQQVMVEVLERHKSEIDAARQQYQQMHPWAAPNN
jgi:uncharacterized protein